MFCDTSAFIDYLREHPIAIRHFEQIRTNSEAAFCSVITETELSAGMRNDVEELNVAEVLSRFEVIPVTSSVARIAGNLLKGKSGGEIRAHFGDALIAATAIQNRETILTADGKSQRVFGNQANYLVYR